MAINRKNAWLLVFCQYPEEIEKLFKICEPYEDKIENGELKDVPQEIIEAFEKTKEWAWEQGQ